MIINFQGQHVYWKSSHIPSSLTTLLTFRGFRPRPPMIENRDFYVRLSITISDFWESLEIVPRLVWPLDGFIFLTVLVKYIIENGFNRSERFENDDINHFTYVSLPGGTI